MNLIKKIKEAKNIVILGHVKPDGDCIGSSTAIYQYIKNIDNDKDVDIIMDTFINCYSNVPVMDKIISKSNKEYDLCFCMDCASRDRLGINIKYFDEANYRIVIDHHKTNINFGDFMFLEPNKSSTSEVLYYLLDKAYINKGVATSLFTGLIADTGVFRYSCTSKSSFIMAAELMDYGISHTEIIEESYYNKSDKLNRFIAQCVLNRKLIHNGKTIYTIVDHSMMKEFDITNTEFEGIVESLRDTIGVEVALFAYEIDKDKYKVSLRSKKYVDVSKICQLFGGGGHDRASGCTLKGDFETNLNNLLNSIENEYV